MAKEIDHGVQEWGRKEGLTEKTIQTLIAHDLMSLETIRLLTWTDVNDIFLTPKLISVGQGLVLRKAIEKLKGEPSSQSEKELSSTTNVEDCVTQTTSKLPSNHSKSTRAETFRFLLVGKTGSGKSSTGNTILGEYIFDTEPTLDGVTQKCAFGHRTHNNVSFEVTDSPGLYDPNLKMEDVALQVMQGVACMHPGPDAILYVIQACRYTEEDYRVYERLKSLLDEDVRKYMVIVFTHGDSLEKRNMSVERLIDVKQESFKKVLQDCDKRCVVFNNTVDDTLKRPQVDRLVEVVRKMKMTNSNLPYSCPNYAMIGSALDSRIFKIMLNDRLNKQRGIDAAKRGDKTTNNDAESNDEKLLLKSAEDIYDQVKEIVKINLSPIPYKPSKTITSIPEDKEKLVSKFFLQCAIDETPEDVQLEYEERLLETKQKICVEAKSKKSIWNKIFGVNCVIL